MLVNDQEGNAMVVNVLSLERYDKDHNCIATGIKPTTVPREAFFEYLVHGDSGRPLFFVLETNIVLIGTFWSGGAGSCPWTTHYLEDIQNRMDSLLSGYSLEILDLSTYLPLQ